MKTKAGKKEGYKVAAKTYTSSPNVRVEKPGWYQDKPSTGDRAKDTKQFTEDSFEKEYGGSKGIDILKPKYNLEYLVKVPPGSSILSPCIDFKEVGVGGFGYSIEATGDAKDKSIEDAEVEQEKDELDFFYRTCNPKRSFVEIVRSVVRDRETTGNAYLEVIRTKSGELAGFEPVLPHNIRLCAADPVGIDYNYTVRIGTEIREVKSTHRFRRYAMRRDAEDAIIYFKEWGDIRSVDRETGEYTENPKIQASEIIHFSYYNPHTFPYGSPRWVSNLDSIVGLQDAESVNQSFFRNKGMPNFIICVSGGEVPEKVEQDIREYIENLKKMDSTDQFYSILVLHAKTPDLENFLPEDRPKPPVIDIKPITPYLQSEALFKEYMGTTRDYVRSSFRIGDIFLGGGNTTQASAEVAKRVVEEWVLNPERMFLQYKFNQINEREFGARYTKMVLRGPDVVDYDKVTQALSRIQGAVTPNDIRGLVGKILGKDLQPWKEPWADEPIILISNAAGLSALNGARGGMDQASVSITQDMAKRIEKVETQQELLGAVSKVFSKQTKDS